MTLNIFETRYFGMQVRRRVQSVAGINPLKLNLDWPSIRQDPEAEWMKQQDVMGMLTPLLGGLQGMVPAGGAAGGAAAEAEPAEKTHFDIELSGFETKSKIKVIKEIRGLLGLGLKEAKEMVEGSPVWIKKEMPKEEAEEIKAKLEAIGAEIKLA